MSIQERKYSIIEEIMNLNDADLARIESVLQDKIELNESLKKSFRQVEKGNVVPHAEVRKKYEKWL